MELKQKQKLN